MSDTALLVVLMVELKQQLLVLVGTQPLIINKPNAVSEEYDGTSWTAGGTLSGRCKIAQNVGALELEQNCRCSLLVVEGSSDPAIKTSTQEYDGSVLDKLLIQCLLVLVVMVLVLELKQQEWNTVGTAPTASTSSTME